MVHLKRWWKLELLKKLKPRKLNGTFVRFSKNVVDDFQGSYWMWNKTIRYNVKLLASRCFFYYFQHSLFEHTGVFANFKKTWHTINCISVLYYFHSRCTLFVLLLLPRQSSIVYLLVYFQNKQSVSTGHTVWGINHFKSHVHNFSIWSFCVIF